MSKFTDMIQAVKETKQVRPDKQVELEKGDYKALVIAALQVFGPVLIGMLVFFALIIWIVSLLWS